MTDRRQGYKTTQSDRGITISGLLQLGVMLVSATFGVLISGRTLVAGSMGWIDSDYPLHFNAIRADKSLLDLSYSPIYLVQRAILVTLDNYTAVIAAGILLLGLIIALKGIIVSFFVIEFGFTAWLAVLITCLLLVAMPFPTLGIEVPFYLGTVSPNVFHSATQIAANALAIPAVYCLTVWYARPTFGWTLAVLVAGALSALSKPALTPAWLVVFVVLSLVGIYRKRLRDWKVIVAAGAASLVPLATLVLAGSITRTAGAGPGRSSYSLSFGENWLAFTPNIPLALLRSWAFPLVVLFLAVFALGWEPVRRFLAVPWAVTLVSTSFFFFVLQTVDGVPRFHGNLAFGAVAATGALYVLSLRCLILLRPSLQVASLLVLSIQGIAGVLYLNRWLSSGFYF